MSDSTPCSKSLPSREKPWLKLYDPEVLSVTIPDVTMYRLITDSNSQRHDKTALVYFDRKISYGVFLEKIRKTAAALAAHGISAGDTVSILSLHTPETLYVLYALNYLGATANFLIFNSSTAEMMESIAATKSKLVFVLDAILKEHKDFAPPVPVIVLALADSAPGLTRLFLKLTHKKPAGFLCFRQFLSVSGPLPPEAADSDAPSVILYTSGTTGNPKGVVLSSRNINAFAVQSAVSGRHYTPGETFLCIIPPFISFGLGVTHLCLYTGLTEILQLVPEVTKVIKIMKKYRPKRFVFGPGLTDIIVKNPEPDLSYLMELTGGGGSISADLERTLNRILQEKKSPTKYLSGYGMTELASGVTMNQQDRWREQSIGFPLPLTTILIADIEDGHELPYNQEGEILVSSPSIMLGYFKNPKDTDSIIEIRDGQRWLHTGDLGTMDEDGFIYVTGRIKRIFLTAGKNNMLYKLFPQRLEDLVESLPQVQRCAVVVQEHPEKLHVPVVFVSAEPRNEDLKENIRSVIARELPANYMPEQVIFMDSFPMTSSQKIDYRKLEEFI